MSVEAGSWLARQLHCGVSEWQLRALWQDVQVVAIKADDDMYDVVHAQFHKASVSALTAAVCAGSFFCGEGWPVGGAGLQGWTATALCGQDTKADSWERFCRQFCCVRVGQVAPALFA